MTFTDTNDLFTERGISRPDLDRLDAALTTLDHLHTHICARMFERNCPAPHSILSEVATAIADLTREPVNTKADWNKVRDGL